ncbi:response regulator transcription factor [Allokutzneria sp. NRRL B-24872]|uniref:DNA-binding response regulator n=1 Tax=Allokutzneria sp. NRRL B-24872 TaxID=1137961 RepID=UPI00143CE147|nr:response regulator transcription factor [Allokutzneria sp. NRRL B-24872]
MSITVVVIDDHPAIAAGVRVWCASANPPIKVLCSGANVRTAWLEPGSLADVVVFDLQLAGGTPAFGDLRRLVDDGRKVVVYTMRDDPDTALTCLDIGASGYVTKAEGEKHLVGAVRAAAHDLPYTTPALAGALGTDSRGHRPKLAPREVDVLIEWFHCESKEMVARKLSLSVRTVNSYIDRVRVKYANAGRDAPTKAALVARAIQDGLIDVGDL